MGDDASEEDPKIRGRLRELAQPLRFLETGGRPWGNSGCFFRTREVDPVGGKTTGDQNGPKMALKMMQFDHPDV